MKYKLTSAQRNFLLVCLLLPWNSVNARNADQYQQIPDIHKAVEAFVYEKTRDLPGQVIVTPGKIDNRITLPYCPKLEPFIPTGGRLWGNSSVGVRCDDQTSWTIYVQVDVKIMADVVHAARPTASGQPLADNDLMLKNVNLAHMPEGVFTDPAQVVGKVLISGLTVGQPVRQHLLRAPNIIVRGQKVKLYVQGRGFNVSSEGHALSDAAEGQVVQVRNQSGRIISGIALPNAIVSVSP